MNIDAFRRVGLGLDDAARSDRSIVVAHVQLGAEQPSRENLSRRGIPPQLAHGQSKATAAFM
jgi:hypothetical protein